MKSKFIFAIIVLLGVSTINASAQSNPNLHQENKRINEGVRSGALTPKETERLENEKARLHNEAIRDKTNNGHIGPREKANLRHDRRRLDRNIYHQKHDRQRRF